MSYNYMMYIKCAPAPDVEIDKNELSTDQKYFSHMHRAVEAENVKGIWLPGLHV